MNNLKKYCGLFVGIICMIIGVGGKILFGDNDVVVKACAPILGFGGGIVGVAIVRMLQAKKREQNAELAREYEIAEADERNCSIREKAAYATWFLTMLMLAVLTLAALIIENLTAIIIIGIAFVFHIICFFVATKVYDKKM